MDDIKIFANGKELETLIQTVRIFGQDTEMKFEIKILAMFKINKEKEKKLIK